MNVETDVAFRVERVVPNALAYDLPEASVLEAGRSTARAPIPVHSFDVAAAIKPWFRNAPHVSDRALMDAATPGGRLAAHA